MWYVSTERTKGDQMSLIPFFCDGDRKLNINRVKSMEQSRASFLCLETGLIFFRDKIAKVTLPRLDKFSSRRTGDGYTSGDRRWRMKMRCRRFFFSRLFQDFQIIFVRYLQSLRSGLGKVKGQKTRRGGMQP